jgi:prolyl oligopeptidase
MNTEKGIILAFLVLCISTLNAQQKYPKTAKIPVIDTYHNIQITDNYKWLESLISPEVKKWVKDQNKVSLKYLKKLANTNGSKAKMRAFNWHEMVYDNYVSAQKNKKIYYRLMYPGRNSLANIYYAQGNKSSFEKLISPSSISTKDKINFTGLIPSYDDRFLAYQYNRNGSDWNQIKIVGIKKRYFFKEVLSEVLSPQINWYGQGFFYVKHKYSPNDLKRTFPEVMYHKLDTPQSKDAKIFKVDNEHESLNIYGTPKQSLYIIKKADKFKNRFSYYYLIPKSEKKEFKSFFENIKYDMDIIRFKSDTIFATTRINNKKYLINFPIKAPKKWNRLTTSYKGAVLTGYVFAKEKIISAYQTEKSSIIAITNLKGKVLGEVLTPEGMSVSQLYFNKEKNELTFNLSSYTVPPVICLLDLKQYTFKYSGKTEVSFDAKKYKFVRKKFISHDGKEVPMFIVYKDSIQKNGQTPFLLKTYGGYGNIAKPSFDPGVIYFIERGGAFAYVHIRGGGELGYQWWQDGKKMKKKNGILDFTKAAEFLIKEGYTKPKKIGIIGASHGGMITAAAMIEKPEYYGAAVINVGALDMLSIEKTLSGSAYVNISEFGSVNNKEEFLNLWSYSPYHTVKETVDYPSTLIITGSNDTRVPAYQSYKFAARLQNRSQQKNPVLLWSQDKAGHFGAAKYNSIIEESTFIYSFLFNELTKFD